MPIKIPQSLTIALNEQHLEVVKNWWASLSDADQNDFVATAVENPLDIFEPLSAAFPPAETEPNDWFEYIVNQDVRFYLDIKNGAQTSHGWLTNFTISPIPLGTNGKVISHVLSRPKKN